MRYSNKRVVLVIGLLLLFTLAVVACEPEQVEVTRVVEVEVPGAEVEVTREVEVEVPGAEVEVTRVVEVMVEPEVMSAVSVVPFEEAWAGSPHANAEAEAFIHWDEDDPQEVPASCAKCHSTPGFMAFVGADGSEAGVVEGPAPIGTVIECQACHNDMTVHLDTVVFPSGAEISGLDAEARCMQCHQGRHSTVSVNASIEEAGLDPEADLDTVSEDLGFSNIHYYAAAATQFGTLAKGGYEYDGKSYDSKFDHVEGFDTCVSCHDSHTLEVQVEECTVCHTDVASVEDFATVRMLGSLVDYDGDGDMEEGIMGEITGLQEALYQAMQDYGGEVAGTGIVYDSHAYPYFFIDTDGDGQVTEGEAAFPNAFNAWTPRLAKAAYNYQVSQKDPGEFAHGGKYIIQLLYDSIEDLNQAVAAPVDMSAMSRIDHGHFAGSEEAFRHWDEDGFVPASCSKCHSAAGLPLFATEGVTIAQEPSNGLNCATCHSDLETLERYVFTDVTFPSGATVSFAEGEEDTAGLDANLCINCHQGRSSTVTVDGRIGELSDDEVSDALGFINIHYFAAGATLFGDVTKGAYQYADQQYVGRNEHVGAYDTCIECHSSHALEVEYEACSECHEVVETPEDLIKIRISEVDYDGDGDVEEGISGEIDTMREALYAAILAYASSTPGVDPIVYESHSYPYFFIDTNGDGEATPDEANFGNRYATWTPALLRAAYNYQYAAKDPGAYAHNAPYVIQVLYDSINAMGGDVSAMTRPPVE